MTAEIITDKFDVLRGRLLENHNDFRIFHLFILSTTSEKSFIPYKDSATAQAVKVSTVRPKVLSSWELTLLEKLRAADEN